MGKNADFTLMRDGKDVDFTQKTENVDLKQRISSKMLISRNA